VETPTSGTQLAGALDKPASHILVTSQSQQADKQFQKPASLFLLLHVITYMELGSEGREAKGEDTAAVERAEF